MCVCFLVFFWWLKSTLATLTHVSHIRLLLPSPWPLGKFLQHSHSNTTIPNCLIPTLKLEMKIAEFSLTLVLLIGAATASTVDVLGVSEKGKLGLYANLSEVNL